MRWIRDTKYSIASECGLFKISKQHIGDDTKYSLWRDKKLIDVYTDSEAAKREADKLKDERDYIKAVASKNIEKIRDKL